MNKKILLSGIKPTGRPHIGNYFGAMRQFVHFQDEFEAFVMIADLHALTTVQNRKEMEENTLGVLLDYLAIGLDPEKVCIFKQSDVPAHSELAWIFDCLTTMPYLMRAHAFKDAEAKNKEINVGVFNYPMLMASDILLYDADLVPVGQDQKQHIEITRDTAQKFNNTFGDTLKLPEPFIIEEVGVVPGTDGQKMAKSYGNTISLFATDEEIEKAVAGIVTDSGADIPQNVYAIHKLFKTEAELAPLYDANKGKYKILKDALAADIKAFIGPMREKRNALAQDMERVKSILKAGGEKARARAEAKMSLVHEKVGMKIY